MKSILIKMGGKIGSSTIYFQFPLGTVQRRDETGKVKRTGKVWTSGDVYDFIHVVPRGLRKKDIMVLIDLLSIKSLPARHPLRRELVRMMIRDDIKVDEFYTIIRNQSVSAPKAQPKKESKKQLPKGMPSWIETKKRNGFSIALKSQFIYDEAKKLEKEAKRKGQRGLFVGYGQRLYLMNNFQGDRSEILSKIIAIYQENEEHRKIGEIAQKMKMRMIEEVNKLSPEERTEEKVNEIVSPLMEYKLPRVKIVGIQYTNYSAQKDEVISLVHEKDNPHDENAIGAYNSNGNRFGYVATAQTVSVGNRANGVIDNKEVLELLPNVTKVIVEDIYNNYGYAKLQL